MEYLVLGAIAGWLIARQQKTDAVKATELELSKALTVNAILQEGTRQMQALATQWEQNFYQLKRQTEWYSLVNVEDRKN
jgi:hypothetical protein